VGEQNKDKLNMAANGPFRKVWSWTAGWLEKHGYSRSLRNKYVAQWLGSISSRGVFTVGRLRSRLQRPATKPLRWQNWGYLPSDAVGASVTVGGRTALELQDSRIICLPGAAGKSTCTATGKTAGMGIQVETGEPVRLS